MDLSTVQNTIARWWFHYDEADFEVWPDLMTSDVAFTCRSDIGNTSYEEFIRADVRGRSAVLSWQRDHRNNSPFPLRHNGTNVHLTRVSESEADFMSYLFVTQIVDGKVSNLSSGLCSGTVRDEDGVARLAALHVVLDTQESVVLSARPVEVGSH
jgi:hypothetical protein